MSEAGQNYVAPGCPTSDLQEATDRLLSPKNRAVLMNIEFSTATAIVPN
jgi:hypothetical protein